MSILQNINSISAYRYSKIPHSGALILSEHASLAWKDAVKAGFD